MPLTSKPAINLFAKYISGLTEELSPAHLRRIFPIALAEDSIIPNHTVNLNSATAVSEALASEDTGTRRAAFTLKVLGVADHQKLADKVIEEVAPTMTAIDALEPFVTNSTLTRGIINRCWSVGGTN